MPPTTIGLDLAKYVFQIHAVAADGKVQLGQISKAGDRNLRRLLVLGATSLVHRARIDPEKAPWIAALLARRPARVVTVAVANKLARIAWAVLSRKEIYRQDLPAAA